MKAKDLVCLMALILGTMVGCKKYKDPPKVEFIARWHSKGYVEYKYVGNQPNIFGMAYDFEDDGVIDSLQIYDKGYSRNSPNSSHFFNNWQQGLDNAKARGTCKAEK